MLDLEQEKTLWARYKEQADESARDELVVAHMRLVRYVAGRMAIHVPSTVELDDLIGWGVLGLMDAAEKFDHTQDVKFSTYATIRVRGSILDQIRSLDWAPRSLRAMARKVGAARDKLRQEKGLEPSTDDIGEELGATGEQVEDCLAQVHTAHVLSLDDYLPADEGETRRTLDVTVAGQGATPETAARGVEKRERIVEAILNLPDQQQKVLHLYYYEELTLKEIGAVLEVSESRICQVHSAALKNLRDKVMGEAAR